MYIHIYIYIERERSCVYIYIYIEREICTEIYRERERDGVYKPTLLLREPLPCNAAAETALAPLVWCFESVSSRGYSYPEECFVHRHWHAIACSVIARYVISCSAVVH